jgi:hypothetical protein
MTVRFSGTIGQSHASALAYRPGRALPCPSCGERQWLVGRIVAECACCQTALPIDLNHRSWNATVAQPTPLVHFPIS